MYSDGKFTVFCLWLNNSLFQREYLHQMITVGAWRSGAGEACRMRGNRALAEKERLFEPNQLRKRCGVD